jgi:hypothetical protein
VRIYPVHCETVNLESLDLPQVMERSEITCLAEFIQFAAKAANLDSLKKITLTRL